MSMLSLRWQDISGLERVQNAMGRLSSHEQYLAMQRAVNHTGDKARTVVIRTLAKQTGLKSGVIRRAIRTSRAWGASASSFSEGRGSLQYILWTQGGEGSFQCR